LSDPGVGWTRRSCASSRRKLPGAWSGVTDPNWFDASVCGLPIGIPGQRPRRLVGDPGVPVGSSRPVRTPGSDPSRPTGVRIESPLFSWKQSPRPRQRVRAAHGDRWSPVRLIQATGASDDLSDPDRLDPGADRPTTRGGADRGGTTSGQGAGAITTSSGQGTTTLAGRQCLSVAAGETRTLRWVSASRPNGPDAFALGAPGCLGGTALSHGLAVDASHAGEASAKDLGRSVQLGLGTTVPCPARFSTSTRIAATGATLRRKRPAGAAGAGGPSVVAAACTRWGPTIPADGDAASSTAGAASPIGAPGDLCSGLPLPDRATSGCSGTTRSGALRAIP
jgi:hypothetical protein